MYIEDMIYRMVGEGTYLFKPALNLFTQDARMAHSFAAQLITGRGFTEKQAAVALRFCQKYKSQLEAAFGQDLTQEIANPKYMYPLRTVSEQQRQVALTSENPKKLKVTFNYDENLVKLIREWKSKNAGNIAEWDPDNKAWMFNLTEGNIHFVKQHLIPQNFHISEEVMDFVNKIDKIVEDFEQYVPMVVAEGDQFVFKNTHPSIPQLETTNLLDAIFTARKYGVSTWDETIENRLRNENNWVTLSFIKCGRGKMIKVDSSVYEISTFSDIVRHAKNILVIIPANNELVLIQKWHNFLISEGILADEMAVLFRLENSANKEFNDYVKSNQLNLPLNSKTRIFFISQKLPKPLIKNRTEFDLVLNLGSEHAAHYSIQNLLSENPDIIIYNNKGKNGVVL